MAFAPPPYSGNVILRKVPIAKQHSEPFIPVACIHVGYALLYPLLWIFTSVFGFVHTNVCETHALFK